MSITKNNSSFHHFLFFIGLVLKPENFPKKDNLHVLSHSKHAYFSLKIMGLFGEKTHMFDKQEYF